jgi:HAD superfamily hydrolase (TIGR01450 family)
MTERSEDTTEGRPQVRGVVVDLDGTVYRGTDPIPGAAAALARLRERGVAIVFCSNNPTETPAEYVERLAGMGVEADESAVVPASTVTRDYLRDHHPDEPVYLVSSASLRAYLREAGQQLTTDPERATVFVASWDETFDYGEMQAALDCIDETTTFLGTDPDRTVPTGDGLMPGSGAILRAVAGTVDRDPDRVLGKPSSVAARAVLERLDLPPEACLVVGDRLDTDLAMGVDHGMATALVTTGVSSREDVPASDVTPDYVLDSLADLPDLLEGENPGVGPG